MRVALLLPRYFPLFFSGLANEVFSRFHRSFIGLSPLAFTIFATLQLLNGGRQGTCRPLNKPDPAAASHATNFWLLEIASFATTSKTPSSS
jgi:hypothetical protein